MKIAAPQIVPARMLLMTFAAFSLMVSSPGECSDKPLQPKREEAVKDISGTWIQSTKGAGESTWIISKNPDGTYKAVESGLGEAVGTATLEGTTLKLRFATGDGAYVGTYEWTLNKQLTSGAGRLRFEKTRVPSQYEYGSTVSRIPPPIWRQAWFISLVALLVLAGAYGTHRYRLHRLIELERVRTRVASDLHDDIGSNLSLIAGLSEVLEQHARPRDPQMAEKLSMIASVSRRSVDAMSDIIWAVNPKLDNNRRSGPQDAAICQRQLHSAQHRVSFRYIRAGEKRPRERGNPA